MCTYALLKKQFSGAEQKDAVTYGIRASFQDETVQCTIHFMKEEALEQLVELLNRNEISLLHFEEVVEDYFKSAYRFEKVSACL